MVSVTCEPLVGENAHTPKVTLVTQELLGSSFSSQMGIEDLVSQALFDLEDKVLIGSQEQQTHRRPPHLFNILKEKVQGVNLMLRLLFLRIGLRALIVDPTLNTEVGEVHDAAGTSFQEGEVTPQTSVIAIPGESNVEPTRSSKGLAPPS